jgi:hypothetical protein
MKNLPEELLKELENNIKKDHEVIHAVFPMKEIKHKLDKKINKPFVSVYLLNDTRTVLAIKGFNEMPYLVPRWSKVSGEMYGRSPAMAALADIKMINDMSRVNIRGAQKIVDPPLMIDDDGVLLPLNVNPGGFNYKRPGAEAPTPLVTGARPDIGEQMMESVRTRIKQAFFIDQLQLDNGPQMTATEVRQRTEEKLRLLGPVLARQQFELLRPMIDRLFNIMLRQELLLEVPQELEGGSVAVRYSSDIAKAQRLAESDSLLRAIQMIGPVAEFDPTVLDNLNGDETVKAIAKLAGLPQEVLRNEEEIAELREQRAEAQEKQAQHEDELADAEKVSKVAPVLNQGQ